MPRKTTIVIADDHSLIRSALAELLSEVRDFEVTHEVGTADEALRATATSSPSVVILDIGMPGTDAFQAAAEIRQISPQTEIVFLSGTLSDSTIDSARNSGARGYVVKADSPEEVVSAVHAVIDGRTYYSPAVQARLPEVIGRAGADSRLASLSPRELETLGITE